MKYGYKFEVIEGYLFKKKYIFEDYIKILYKMKSDTDSSDPKYYIANLLMYGLFWRFGLNPDNNIVEITTPPPSGAW